MIQLISWYMVTSYLTNWAVNNMVTISQMFIFMSFLQWKYINFWEKKSLNVFLSSQLLSEYFMREQLDGIRQQALSWTGHYQAL